MRADQKTGSIIFAAGRGSRMKNFNGNKTLLPLVPGSSPFEGSHPILLHILDSLPAGPKALVIKHRKEDVIEFTRSIDLTYCEQPQLNGTGGALLASRKFLEGLDCDQIIIAMGDVPFVSTSTYHALLNELNNSRMAVLGFRPPDKKRYGVLEFDADNVKRITEWKYLSKYSKENQDRLEICNSGIYAAKKDDLIQYLRILEQRPHTVLKKRNEKMVEVKEFFITDLIELTHKDGLKVGHVIAGDEDEVMGIDDLPSLLKAQEIFRERNL
ncbi:MAG: NTP transferase domain-containing protein [Deltaproteobacteria bacterium]|nr:NTP transferase domain-containing protein [Deltaproteobacteria bacterium]